MPQQNFKQTKAELRSKLSEERALLSVLQVQDYSDKIIKKLIDYISWDGIKSMHTYQAIKNNNEIDTSSLINFVKQHYPETKIVLAENKASATRDVPENQTYDLVIVPLISFDRAGNRLGYGGGYYDKFLDANDCKLTIGLAYSFQEVKNLPSEPHDQKLDLIIAENEVIKT